MGGGMAGPGSGAPGGMPEDMMFLRLAHLETFLGKFSPQLADIQIGDVSKRVLLMAIEAEGGGGQSLNMPWRVRKNTDPLLPLQYDYVGGTAYIQGEEVTVPDGNVSIAAEGDSGVVALEITRDSSSRLPTAVMVKYFSGSLPSSDYLTQYRALAFVGGFPDPIQLQFGEIRIDEELIVVNGYLTLQTYEISHRNNYDPPP